MIWESSLIVATNADILSVGRLNSLPYNGTITFRFLADLGDATNNYTLTLQKPGGDVPIDGQRVVASASAADMVMDERELMQFTFAAVQGGHFVVSLTEAGTAVCAFQAILRP